MASFDVYYDSLVSSDPRVGLPLTKAESRKFCRDWMPLLVRLYVKHFGRSVVHIDCIVDSAGYQSDLSVLVNLFKVEERVKGKADVQLAYQTLASILPKHTVQSGNSINSNNSNNCNNCGLWPVDNNAKRSSSSSVYCSPHATPSNSASYASSNYASSNYDRTHPDSTFTESSIRSSISSTTRYESLQSTTERLPSPQPLSDTATLIDSTKSTSMLIDSSESSSMGSDTLESDINQPLSIGFANENELFQYDTSDAVGNSLVGWTKTRMAQPAKINSRQRLRTIFRV